MYNSGILQGQNISKVFPVESGVLRRQTSEIRALVDVSFQVQKGEILAIVGGSGSGKTTLAKLVVGLLAADQGTLLWEGRPLAEFDRLERARKIQMVFQDPYASLNPKLSIGTQLQEALRLAVPSSAQQTAEALLEAVGLPADVLGHYPFQFSGGQRQRIAIARSLALHPDLLIADEPLSALDVSTQAQILELLRALRQDRGLTMLFITHDLAVAHMFADRILVMREGKIIEEGPVQQVLQAPQQEYTRALVDAIPRISWDS